MNAGAGGGGRGRPRVHRAFASAGYPTIVNREQWIERFCRVLTELMTAGEHPQVPQPTHAGLIFGPYEVRAAVARPGHEESITIVVLEDLPEQTSGLMAGGVEFHGRVTSDPLPLAARVAAWLEPRLATD